MRRERKLRKRERRNTLEWAQIPMQGAAHKSRHPALIRIANYTVRTSTEIEARYNKLTSHTTTFNASTFGTILKAKFIA